MIRPDLYTQLIYTKRRLKAAQAETVRAQKRFVTSCFILVFFTIAYLVILLHFQTKANFDVQESYEIYQEEQSVPRFDNNSTLFSV